jgi:hypothetical protein
MTERQAGTGTGTDELRGALDELRHVLDVGRGRPDDAPGGRWHTLLLLGAPVAILLVAALLLLGRGPATIVRPPAHATPPGASVRPLPWPGGPVVDPPGLTTTGPGATDPGTDVQVAVDDDGRHLDVVERLLLERPATDALQLVAPTWPAVARPAVTDLQVVLDDRVAAVRTDGPGGWTVHGAGWTRATLRYRLDAAVVTVAPAAPGRALGLVTPLTAAASRASGRPVVLRAPGPHVVGVSCPGALGTGAICGSRTAAGWSAAVPPTAAPVVLLQLDLPPEG